MEDITNSAKKVVEYLYPIKGDVTPELERAIGTLRQLINEEFVGKNKSVSSQVIYDILNPAINQTCNQARIDELEIVRWAAVCADAPYINENDRAGFNAVKEQVTNHIDDRIKELKELNNEL